MCGCLSQSEIQREFSARYNSDYAGNLRFEIPSSSLSNLGDAFEKLQEIQSNFGAGDFEIANPTLEQVFLLLAEKQKDCDD